MSEIEMAAADAASPAEAIVEAPAVEVSTPEQVDAERTAELRAIWDKHNPPRAPDGKFSPRNPVEPDEAAPVEGAADEPEGQSPETEAVEPEKPAINAPVSWPAEMKAKFGTLPPDVQEYVHKRESESQQAISRMGNQIASVKPVVEILEQYKGRFEKAGLAPAEGIDRLLNVEAMLEANPYTAIQQIANAYGVDLGLFNGGQPSGESNAEIAGLKRQIEHLTSQLQETSTRVMTREQREQIAEQQAVEAQIAEFVKDKPDFDALEAEMLVAIPAIRQQKRGLSPKEVLAEAYEQAKWLNPQTREKMLAEQRKAEAAKQAEEAKKRAAEAKKVNRVNVRAQEPVTGLARSSDDTLREIAARAYGHL